MARHNGEHPLHERLRARKLLLHGGTADDTRWAFERLVDFGSIPDPYDGRTPAAALEALLKSDLRQIPDQCLERLGSLLGDKTTGLFLTHVAAVLALIPLDRISLYLEQARGQIDAKRDAYNAASLAYVSAMHGDAKARKWLIDYNRSHREPAFQYRYLIDVLERFPGADDEAQRFWTEDYKLYLPPDLLKEALSRPRSRALDFVGMSKEQQVVIRCRQDYSVRHERADIIYLRPPGRFLRTFGQYGGWGELAGAQHEAYARLDSALTAEEKTVLQRSLERFYCLDGDDFGLQDLVLGWLTNPAPFRLFWD